MQEKEFSKLKKKRKQQKQYNFSNQDKNGYKSQNYHYKQQIITILQNNISNHQNNGKNLQIQSQNKLSCQTYYLKYTKQAQKLQNENSEIQTYFGIQKIGSTCYINSALQILRQIYEENQQFLQQKSSLGQYLKCFFINLSKGCVYQQVLNKLIEISEQNETNQYNQNKNEFNLTQFQQIFTIIFQDGLSCQNCNTYLKRDSIDFPYFQESDTSLDYQNFPKYSIKSVYEGIQTQCYNCDQYNKQSNFVPKRIIVFFPQFLIVKLPVLSYKKWDKKKELYFDKNKCQLMGYCNYNGAHYTNTAKKNNTWISYYDSRIYEIQLNLSQSIYQLKSQDQQKQILWKGIQNIGNSCYMNAALQMLRQIDIIHPNFLDQQQSQLASQLKQLFKLIAANKNVENELKILLLLSKVYSIHESNGGDSYQILYKFLSIINDDVSKQQILKEQKFQLNDFEKHISIISQDGYQCQKCLQFLQKEQDQIQFIQEKDFSIDIQNFDQLYYQPSIQKESQIESVCQQCCFQTTFKTSRSILYFPQFIIVKFQIQNSQNLSQLEGEKEILFQGNPCPYKIIGYSSYSGSHYTYTANYDGVWIKFNDSSDICDQYQKGVTDVTKNLKDDNFGDIESRKYHLTVNDDKNNQNYEIGKQVNREQQKHNLQSFSQNVIVDNLQNESTLQAQKDLDNKVIIINQNKIKDESYQSSPIDKDIKDPEIQDNHGLLQLSLKVNISQNTKNGLQFQNENEHIKGQQKHSNQNDFDQIENKTENQLDEFSKNSDLQNSNSKSKIDKYIQEIKIEDDQQQKHSNLQIQKENKNSKDQKSQSLIENTNNEVKTICKDEQKNTNQQKNQGIIGFNNLGNTCYLNTALQTLRQINQFNNFLEDKNFSNTLKQLFYGQDDVRQKNLNIIFDISKKYQKHLENGGDAYMCVLNLLEEISSEVLDKEAFKKNFIAIFKDGMYCYRCKQYEQSESCDFIYIKEEIIGIESISLDAGILNPQSIYYGCVYQQNCSACNKSTLKPKRELIFAPKFLFFKLIRQENNNQPSKKTIPVNNKQHQKQKKSIIKIEIKFKLFSYILIGFSELYHNHYTYTAKYEDNWYQFSDMDVQKIEKLDRKQNKKNYLIYMKDK
ncbi:hypothetical protein ABPG72_004567 [Tetrahymena utriculariae]